MLVSLTRKEELFQLLDEIPVVVKYLHDAILDDVRHKYPFFVRLSIFKYGKIGNVTSGFQKKCKKGGFLEKKLYLRNGITKNLRI